MRIFVNVAHTLPESVKKELSSESRRSMNGSRSGNSMSDPAIGEESKLSDAIRGVRSRSADDASVEKSRLEVDAWCASFGTAESDVEAKRSAGSDASEEGGEGGSVGAHLVPLPRARWARSWSLRMNDRPQSLHWRLVPRISK
jgi:hypothetical protein